MGQKGATWQKLRYLAGIAVDLVFPPLCASCKSVGELLCSRCMQAIEWLVEPICYKCGRPQESFSTNACYICSELPLPLKQMRTAVFYTGSVATVIKQFKYEGYFGLDKPLADLMIEAWPRWKQPVDLVVPIPLHPARQRERGYNQSELLARRLAKHLDRQVGTAAIKRVRPTRPQVGLTLVERRENVNNAFAAEPELVKGKEILLIDDVRTTGATLIAATDVLLAAGAKSVSAYCLAAAGKDFLDHTREDSRIYDPI